MNDIKFFQENIKTGFKCIVRRQAEMSNSRQINSSTGINRRVPVSGQALQTAQIPVYKHPVYFYCYLNLLYVLKRQIPPTHII